MGILSMIRTTKHKFKQMQTDKHMARAERVKELKQERVRLEGIQNVKDMEAEEKRKIIELKYGSLLKKLDSAKKQIKKRSNKKNPFKTKGNNYDNTGFEYGGKGGIFD